MTRSVALFVLLVGVTGCANDAFTTGGDATISGEDPWGPLPDFGPSRDAMVCRDSIDLVFVLDVSSSMGFVLDKLAQEIGKVVTASNELAPDSHFGLVAFVDNHLLDTTGPAEGGRVHLDGSTLSKAFSQMKALYTLPNRNPGDGPTGPTMQNPICEENANDALFAAAEEFPWRNNSNRVIIVVTDDTFLERPDNYGDRDGDGKTDKKDFPREGDYPALRVMKETVDKLHAAKVRVFAFTRLKPPGPLDPTKCGTGRRLPWTSVSDGWSTPYGGKQPFPAASGGKNFDLDQVFAGKLSLTETINNMVLDSHCKPIE
jgi:hypothetical protein